MAAAAAAGVQKPGWPGPGWFFIPAFKGKGDDGDEEKGMPMPNPKTGEPGVSCELQDVSFGGYLDRHAKSTKRVEETFDCRALDEAMMIPSRRPS